MRLHDSTPKLGVGAVFAQIQPDAINNALHIAHVKCRQSAVTTVESLTWDDLTARLSKPTIGPKDGPGWMPAEIDQGPRTANRVRSISALVLDVEAEAVPAKDGDGNPLKDQYGDTIKRVIGPEPPTVEEIQAELSLHGWQSFIHTSYSHTDEHPRYRVIIQLSRPLAPNELRPLGMYVAGLLGLDDCSDTKCLDPARLFYSPRCPEERLSLFRAVAIDGEALPVDDLLHDAQQFTQAAKEQPRRTGQRGSVIDAFNAAHSIAAILERHGYKARGRRRWIYDGSTSGLPGVRLLPDSHPERIYSSHAGDPLADGKAHDAFDLYRILDHGGDIGAAVKGAAQLMGMDRNDTSDSSGSGEKNSETSDQGTADSDVRTWGAINPIQAGLHPVAPFDPAIMLPMALSEWIMDEADRMPCPPDYVAATVLVALGSIIGASCAIKPKARDDWQVVPNLWGGIVGLPSFKKTPAISAGMKPIDKLIAKAIKTHQGELEQYEIELTVHKARQEALQDQIKKSAKGKNQTGGLDDLARDLKACRENAPKPPAMRRYKTNDTTVEKLGELLRENPNGLLTLRDELVGLIASWERDGREGERAFYLEAWNGNSSFDTDRIGRGSIFIENLCVSIFGGIQPDKLVGYLEQAANALANDGMLQRFQVLVYPDHCPWEWRDRAPNKNARDLAYRVFEKLAEFDPVAWGASPADDFAKFPYFQFDAEAQQVFIEWSTDLHREKLPAEDNPIIAQHLSKFDKLFPAIALVLHLVDCAATGRTGQVTADAALRAAAWCEYLESHARRCYGLLADDGLRAAQALADKLRQGRLADGFTGRDVRRNQWRYLTTDNAVQAALDWLEDEGWLQSKDVGGSGPGTGRRTSRYYINPAVGGGDHG